MAINISIERAAYENRSKRTQKPCLGCGCLISGSKKRCSPCQADRIKALNLLTKARARARRKEARA